MKIKIGQYSAFMMTLVGCHVNPADAPRVNLVPADDVALRSFPVEDLSFNDSQLFLWKKDLPASDVARVLDQTSKLQDEQNTLYTQGVERKSLKIQFETYLNDYLASCKAKAIAACPAAVPPAPSTCIADADEKCRMETDIVTLPDLLEALPGKQEDLAKTTAQIVSLKAQPASEDVSKQIERLTKKQKRLEASMAPVLKAKVAIEEGGFGPHLDRWKVLDREMTEHRQLASDYLKPIDETVWIFNSSPIKFGFHFGSDQKIHATVSNWDLSKINDPEVAEEGNPKEFSTDAFTMGHVTYQNSGGLLTFEVYTAKAIYWFKIARTLYDPRTGLSTDGRIHYKGDIVRCSVTGGAGRPVLVHLRDIVQCGVSAPDADLQPGDEVGKVMMRRGGANLVDLDDKE